MSCDVGKATEGLENECDVGEVTERLENELSYDYNYELSSFSNLSGTSPTSHSFSNPSVALPTSQLILQPFRWFTYVSAHSPTLLSLPLRHRLFTYVIWRAAHVVLESFSSFISKKIVILKLYVIPYDQFFFFGLWHIFVCFKGMR